MKKIILSTILLVSTIKSMNQESPADIIQQFSKSPHRAIQALQDSFRQEQLTGFRDEQYNNLIHIAVQQLTYQIGARDYETVREGYESLVQYLVNSGIDINAVNDGHDSPLIVMYRSPKTDLVFTNFLEDELKAKITYTSFDPELRRLKKHLGAILSYCCPCLGKRKQN